MAKEAAEILIKLCNPPTIGIQKLLLLFGLLPFISLPVYAERYCVINRRFRVIQCLVNPSTHKSLFYTISLA